MKPKIKTVGGKVLVCPEKVKEKLERGIIIPITNNNALEEGIVIDVSDDVLPMVEPGLRVVYPRNAGVLQEYDGVLYKYLTGPTSTQQGDIWAIVTDDSL